MTELLINHVQDYTRVIVKDDYISVEIATDFESVQSTGFDWQCIYTLPTSTPVEELWRLRVEALSKKKYFITCALCKKTQPRCHIHSNGYCMSCIESSQL